MVKSDNVSVVVVRTYWKDPPGYGRALWALRRVGLHESHGSPPSIWSTSDFIFHNKSDIKVLPVRMMVTVSGPRLLRVVEPAPLRSRRADGVDAQLSRVRTAVHGAHRERYVPRVDRDPLGGVRRG
jgi:hypothetical protein